MLFSFGFSGLFCFVLFCFVPFRVVLFCVDLYSLLEIRRSQQTPFSTEAVQETGILVMDSSTSSQARNLTLLAFSFLTSRPSLDDSRSSFSLSSSRSLNLTKTGLRSEIKDTQKPAEREAKRDQKDEIGRDEMRTR